MEGAKQGAMEGVDRGLAGLDARRVRFHDLSADHGADRQGIRRSLNRGHRRVHDHPVDAPGGRDGRRLDGRPDGSKDPADDFHSLVLALQLHRRFFSNLCVFVLFPRAAWHRDGR